MFSHVFISVAANRRFAQLCTFHEHSLWLCVAARSIEQAQSICRQIDPRCKFRFSHVGPPAPAEADDEDEASN